MFDIINKNTNRDKLIIRILLSDVINNKRLEQINKLLGMNFFMFRRKQNNAKLTKNNNINYNFFKISPFNLELRSTSMDLKSEIGMAIFDRKKSIIVESKNNNIRQKSENMILKNYYKDNNIVINNPFDNENSIGYESPAIYSNNYKFSKYYASLFKSIWNQSTLHYLLKKSYEKLKIQNKIQNEFINIVAHELRTPIQPIIGLAEYLKEKTTDEKRILMLETIIASGKNLHKLAENTIDIIKIDENRLSLYKEKIELHDIVVKLVNYYEEIL